MCSEDSKTHRYARFLQDRLWISLNKIDIIPTFHMHASLQDKMHGLIVIHIQKAL